MLARMDRRAWSTMWIGVLTAASLAASCGGPQNRGPQTAGGPAGTANSAGAADSSGEPTAVEPSGRTAEILRAIEDYVSWTLFPEYERGSVRSQGHQGMYVIAYCNDVASPAVSGNDQGAYPMGSLLVKENRPEPDGAPAAITIMSKEAEGWYWIKATADGRVLTENGEPLAGTVNSCIDCHSGASGGDMVFRGKPR